MPKRIIAFQTSIKEGEAIFIDKTLRDYWLARLAKPTDPIESIFIAGDNYEYGQEILNIRKMENNNVPPAPPTPNAPELNNNQSQADKGERFQIVQDNSDIGGKFSNYLNVGFSGEGDYFKLDFIFLDKPQSKMVAKVIVTPSIMHRIIESITQNYQSYLDYLKNNQQ